MIRCCVGLALLVMVLAACGARPSAEFSVGDTLLSDGFEQPGAWDQFDAPSVQMRIAGGVFTVIADAGQYVFALNPVVHGDVVIESELTILSEDRSNGAGVMCRADSARDGDGYYFLIGSDGSASIRRGRGGEITPLLNWTLTSAVRSGTVPNRIRAVCVGDYLALYVNGEFVGDARDSLYSRGLPGVVAVTTRDGERIEVSVDFVNVYAAAMR